jgi:CO/xanthine dehydrogenase Mo-binding subunit
VKWIEDRSENLIAGGHARDQSMRVSFALDADGVVLGARTDLTENVGAFPAGGSGSMLLAAMVVFPGPYRIGAFAATGRAFFTNTGSRCAYRGPWMIETTAREQMMDVAAAELGLDPLELRRRNVIQADDLPFTTAVGSPTRRSARPRPSSRPPSSSDTTSSARISGRRGGRGGWSASGCRRTSSRWGRPASSPPRRPPSGSSPAAPSTST